MTPTFRNKLIGATGYTFVGILVVNIISIFNSIIVARLLDDTLLLGKLFIIQNLQSVVASLILFAIPTAITTYTAKYRYVDKNRLGKFLSNGFTLLTLFITLGTSIYFILSSTIAVKIYNDTSLSLFFKINSLNVMLLTLTTISSELLRGFQKIKNLAILNIMNSFFLMIFLYTFISQLDLLGALIAYTISSLLSLLITALITIRVLNSEKIKINVHLDAPETLETISYSFPIFLSTFIITLKKWFVTTYLSIAVDFSQVGLFKIGNNIQALFLNIPAAINVPLLPMISELQTTSPEKIPNIVIRLFKLSILITLPFIIAAGMSIKYLIVAFYGQTYINAWVFSYIILISLLFLSMSPITQSLFFAMNKTWAVFLLDLFSTGLYVTFSYLLIDKLSLIGIGIADLLSSIIFFIAEIIYLKMGMDIEIQKLGKPLLLSILFISISYFLMTLHDGIILLIEGTALLIILLILEYYILTSEEKDILKTVLFKFLFKYVKKPYLNSEFL